MLKKSITYETFDGETVTDEFYFNISKAELVKMELSQKGGLKEHLERIVASQDGKQIIAAMEDIVEQSYGKKSEDGKHFTKSKEIWEEFKSTEAYSVFFMELVTETDKAVEFVNGVVPKELQDEAAKTRAQMGPASPDTFKADSEPRKLSEAEIEAMDADELKSGLATGKYIL